MSKRFEVLREAMGGPWRVEFELEGVPSVFYVNWRAASPSAWMGSIKEAHNTRRRDILAVAYADSAFPDRPLLIAFVFTLSQREAIGSFPPPLCPSLIVSV
jgi:hypothetical protein